MRIQIVLMLVMAGCSSTTSMQSDGGGGSNDLATSSSTMTVAWDLLNQNLSGMAGNGFSINCDDATVNASTVVFTTKNGNNQTATTMTACPAGMNSGSLAVQLPDTVGPYTLTATLAGKPMSGSDVLRNLHPGDAPHLHVYAFGCDMPMCM